MTLDETLQPLFGPHLRIIIPSYDEANLIPFLYDSGHRITPDAFLAAAQRINARLPHVKMYQHLFLRFLTYDVYAELRWHSNGVVSTTPALTDLQEHSQSDPARPGRLYAAGNTSGGITTMTSVEYEQYLREK